MMMGRFGSWFVRPRMVAGGDIVGGDKITKRTFGKTVYPEIVWTVDEFNPEVQHAEPEGHTIRIGKTGAGHSISKADVVTYSCIVDHATVNTGTFGQYKTHFATREAAEEAAKVKLHQLIDQQVANAKKVLERYTE